MAKIVLATGLVAVYYTGIEYVEKLIRPGVTMQNDTIYIVDKVTADKLVRKGVVTRLDDFNVTTEVDAEGPNVQDVPHVLALSMGAHDVGAKAKEADMSAYVAVTPGDLGQPANDGEGLNIVDDKIVVTEEPTITSDDSSDTVVTEEPTNISDDL
jgi:hypothetical protein